MRVTNAIPLGCSLLLPVGTVNSVQTLKAALEKDVVVNKLGYWTDSGAFYYADIPFKHNLTAMAETAGPGRLVFPVVLLTSAVF
jgi:hypothetical protein